MDMGNNYDTALSELNVGVRIERTINRDVKPQDEESGTTAGRELYPPSILSDQVWDKTEESGGPGLSPVPVSHFTV